MIVIGAGTATLYEGRTGENSLYGMCERVQETWAMAGRGAHSAIDRVERKLPTYDYARLCFTRSLSRRGAAGHG